MPPINPDPPGSPSFRPQIPVRLSDLRQIAEQSRQMMHSANTGSVGDMGAGMGWQEGAELVPEGFFARLTSIPVSVSQPWFSFIEVQDDGTGEGWTTPNGAAVVPYAAFEGSTPENLNINVPGAATLSVTGGGSPPSTTIYYVVTATWQNALGQQYQGPLSNEISVNAGAPINLAWTKPVYSLNQTPSIWAYATVPEWQIVGYQVWAGTVSGQQTRLVASVDNLTTSYTDNGNGAGTVQSPILGGNAGPVVWMSPRSAWNYYRFFFPPKALLQAWIKVTSTAPLLVQLAGGGVLQVWRAVVENFFDNSAVWSDGSACWWYEINGKYPELNGRYLCRLLAMDACTSPVFATEQIVGTTTTTLTPTTTTGAPANTTTIAPCSGTCLWVWNGSYWSLNTNGCIQAAATTTTSTTAAPTTTTTAGPGGTTTCNPIVTTTTTTTTAAPTTTTTTQAPLTCGCMPPQYCGTYVGECTVTICATGILPPQPNCGSTTTTSGPTTTTTRDPQCSTTISPACTNCCWIWNGLYWTPTSTCSGSNCFCPGGPTDYGTVCGNTTCSPCYQTTPPPPPTCSGGCYWTWITPPGQWVRTGGGCSTTGQTNCPCTCPYPTFAGSVCDQVTSTPCMWQCATTPNPCPNPCLQCTSTTTTKNPCGTGCYWQWTGSAWNLVTFGCLGNCNCCVPGYNGTQICESSHTDCIYPPICPTTTTTTTSTTTTSTTTTTTTHAPCGTCSIVYNNDCSVQSITNNCTGGCSCGSFPSCPQGGGWFTVNCVTGTTTTTTTQCPGNCGYILGNCQEGGLGGITCLGVLLSNTCGTGCGCCWYITAAGANGQIIYTNCQHPAPCSNGAPTAGPGTCYWCLCGTNDNQWCYQANGNGCSAGQQCAQPTIAPTSAALCCNGCTNSSCTAATTSTTTTSTTGAPCGTCGYTWTGSIWSTPTNNCTGGCGCTFPTGSGGAPGQTTITPCH